MVKEFEYERDRVIIRGADEDELAASVERHIAEAQPDLIEQVSREDVRASAKEA